MKMIMPVAIFSKLVLKQDTLDDNNSDWLCASLRAPTREKKEKEVIMQGQQDGTDKLKKTGK